MTLQFYRQIFEGILKYQISWNSVQWEHNCSLRTDRQTDITKLTVALRNFAKAFKNDYYYYYYYYHHHHYYYTIWMSLVTGISSRYISWTSGDPHRSRFKLHTAVLSVLCVMFQVQLSFVVNLLNVFLVQLPNFSLSFSLLFQWLQLLLVQSYISGSTFVASLYTNSCILTSFPLPFAQHFCYYYYFAGYTMFPHLPAPIWQLYYLLPPVASVIPVFFHESLFSHQSSNSFRPRKFRSTSFSSSFFITYFGNLPSSILWTCPYYWSCLKMTIFSGNKCPKCNVVKICNLIFFWPKEPSLSNGGSSS